MISVVIPCYNSERYLGKAIESVLLQTRRVDEIVVVDDCSVDQSVRVAESHGVRVLRMSKNGGHASARNAGVATTSGDLIAWLDADDYWQPDHCAIVCGLLEEHSEAAVAFSAVRLFGDRQGVLSEFPCNGKPRQIFWESLRGTIVPAMSAVTRRVPLLEVGGFDVSKRVSPDFGLWLRLSRRYPFVSTSLVTSNYRWHAAQISRSPEKQLLSVYQTRSELLAEIRSEGDAELADRLAKEIEAIWVAEVGFAWDNRDFDSFRRLMKVKKFVPITAENARRWDKRATAPPWAIAAWDAAQTPLSWLRRRHA